ncbi:hypothetical protein P692DRAFT_20836819, partial [Suillus brevipes Sb2]
MHSLVSITVVMPGINGEKDTIRGSSIGQSDRRTKSNPVRNKCKHDESDDRL